MPNISVQLRRGTDTEHSSFTGAVGEVTVDTTNDTLRVHDGSTAGGVRLAKLSEAGGSGTVTSVDSGTGLTGGPITTSGTLSLANTAVSAGSYTNTNLTVDAQGRITAASNGTSGSGDEYVSSQGTATSTTLVANTDTTVGSVTLTLPSGKTWKWVKVVFSTSTQGGQSAFKEGKVKEGTTTLSWVNNHNHTNALSTANDDLSHPSFIFEGVPNTTGSNITLNVTLQGVSGSAQDQTANRSLYAVGIAS